MAALKFYKNNEKICFQPQLLYKIKEINKKM